VAARDDLEPHLLGAVSSGTTAFTALTGAIPSVAPAKTSTGAVIAESSMVRPPSRNRPVLKALLRTKRW
jgi:hypothetical protein